MWNVAKFGMGDEAFLRQYSIYTNIVSLTHLELISQPGSDPDIPSADKYRNLILPRVT